MPAHVYNAGWYADNEGRKYPLDSQSSAVDNFGLPLNHGIIVDLSVAFPESAGSRCMLSGVLITDNMLTAVFSTESGPLASIVVPQPVKPFYHYDLNALQDSVAGVVVFGNEAVTARGSWRFSSVDQSGILPGCYTIMPAFPVVSIGLSNGSIPLTGTVSFTNGPDLSVVTASTYCGAISPLGSENSYTHRALWIGLDTVNNDPVKILRKYTSPCDVRTEEDTCSRRSIGALGGASPDCSGFLGMTGDGGITITSTGNNIVTVDYNKTLEAVCSKKEVGAMLSSANCEVYSVRGAEEAAAGSSANLYTSAIQLLQGGLEYGDSRGVTNVIESGTAMFSVAIPAVATGVLFNISGAGAATAVITDDHIQITLNGDGVSIDGTQVVATTFPFTVRLGTISRINGQELPIFINVHNLKITLNAAYCSDINYE